MKKISKQSQITFVELPPTQFGILNGDLAYDIYSTFKLPSRSIPALMGILKAERYSDIKEINPLYHGIKGKLSSENFKRIFSSDVLLISSITRTSKQSMELADLYKSKNPRGIAIAGGPDPTFRYKEWLKYVDITVLGEAEKTIKEVMKELRKEKKELSNIDGIAFKDKSSIKINKPRRLLTNEELSKLPHPHYDKKTRKNVSTTVIETSRGCPNDCDFCGVTQFYGRKYRIKSEEYVIEELKNVKDMGKYLFFSDDNLVGVPNRAIKLLEEIKKAGVKKNKLAQVTVTAAFNEDLVKALKNAGFKFLCVGIESISDETLKSYGKPYNADKNKEAVKIFRDNGFWIHGMMMLGGDGDTPETLKETLEWINKNLDSAQLFVPIPLPGTRFYEQMEKQERILTKDWFLYDGQHVVIRPKNFTPYELQKRVLDMYKEFYSFKNSFKRNFGNSKVILSTLLSVYANIRGGFKEVLYNLQTKSHLKFLKSSD